MKKKIYIAPFSSVTNLGAIGRLMKDLGPASLSAHPSPRQRVAVF